MTYCHLTDSDTYYAAFTVSSLLVLIMFEFAC